MPNEKNEGLPALAFADAFLETLTALQRDLLHQIISRRGAVTAEDLNSLPALEPLLIKSKTAGLQLSHLVFDILKSQLACHLERCDASLPSDGLATNFEEWLGAQGGPFLAIAKGVEAADAIEAKLPDSLIVDHLSIGLFKVVNALKSGDLSKADTLVAVISETYDLPSLEDCGQEDRPELVCVMFMKAIYSDGDISEKALENLFSMLSKIPKDASIMRAIFYNTVLDVFLRRNEIAMAEEAAQRALFHYRAVGEHGVELYVQFYLVIINLWRGNLEVAQTTLEQAATALAVFQGATSNDALLLRSFELICAYEFGDEQAFLEHLLQSEENIPFGELWPSVAEPIISFGRRALASNITPAAALSWVQRWRVRQWRSDRFDTLISLQEVLALQDLGRWQEADEILSTIETGFGPELQIARFRSALDRAPKSEALGIQLSESMNGSEFSMRQAATLNLLAAQSASNRRSESEAAGYIEKAMSLANPDVFQSFWHEMRHALTDVMSRRELRAEMRKQPRRWRQLQHVLRDKTSLKPDALTRQEFRVLRLLAESQSNKAIGLRLGVSLPTVKFHVANLCKKAQVKSRKEVVQFALHEGWLQDT